MAKKPAAKAKKRSKPSKSAGPGEFGGRATRDLSAWHDWPHGRKPDGLTVNDLYVEMSGTSMATPHVSGILAAFLSARREFIGYPERVKAILLGNCTDLDRDRYIQGAGLPNLVKMLANS